MFERISFVVLLNITVQRCVAVLGDSTVKEVKGHLLSTKNEKVVVKSFPGATTSQMHHYVKPTLEMKPDCLIIHCGTNDLKQIDENQKVVDGLIDLATLCNNKNEIPVIVSSLTCRNDQFKDRVRFVNDLLKSECSNRNIGYIDHDNILESHLNRSRLHLSSQGTILLAKNLKEAISC